MDAVAIGAGAGLVIWMLLDSFETLLATSIRANRLSFTRWYYRVVWSATRRVCSRVRSDARRERLPRSAAEMRNRLKIALFAVLLQLVLGFCHNFPA